MPTLPMTTRTRMLKLPAVLERVGFKKSQLYAKIKAGKFPAPVHYGGRGAYWIEAENRGMAAPANRR